MKSILIATTPRTGSWLLCGALRSTGIAGRPEEYGGPNDEATWKYYHKRPNHAAYFRNLPNELATPNGVRSVKMMWSQFEQFEHDARYYSGQVVGGMDAVHDFLLGEYVIVFLRRRDLLRQAISWDRAVQTDEWSRRDGAARRANDVVPEYRAESIRQAVATIRSHNDRWVRTIRDRRQQVMELYYEDFCVDLSSCVVDIVDFAGITGLRSNRIVPQLERQADELTEEWAARARVELGRSVEAEA